MKLNWWTVAIVAAVAVFAIILVFWSRRQDPSERWTDTLRRFLESNAHLRRGAIFLTAVLSPVALVVLSFYDLLHITKDQALGAVLALAAVGALFGLLLVFTEQTSGEISARAGELDVQLRDAKAALEAERAERAKLERLADREIDRLAALAALRERLFGYLVFDHADQSPNEHEVLIWLLTKETAALGPDLFGWEASERWSLAVYLHDPQDADLFCAADFRNQSNDFGEGHRRWRVGQGMVGITFHAGRELVLSDAESSDLTEVMRDADDQKASEDRTLYRSVAALPIFRPEAYTADDPPEDKGDPRSEPAGPPLFGIVVATSDVPSRFTFDGEDGLAPLRALADAVGMVLMTGELKRPLTGGSPQAERAPEDGRDGDDEGGGRGNPPGPPEPEGA